ncbi:restriction endonuclease [Pseudoalteromonas ardens]|uniref:restriction endonuclease n=1 Tax=Pseudoalteromonas ardens TaxID=3048490 RepID=UPI000676256A|nr:restriction endonuclease [Pseudoalteromonas sp. R96]MDK1313519.1 restriction endonuclease [Pseudoalteromonas sp. R96]
MKEFLSWLKDNLSHMFSLVGIVLTIYFSVFYVPQYSEDIKLKRIEGMNSELISTIQELVYNKHQIDSHDIETLIKGKELRDNIEYPYTVVQLLVQVQETFLANKFIPLESRKELVESIDTVRESLQPETTLDDPREDEISFNWPALVASGLGIIVSMLGSFSLFSSARKQREEEVEERVVDQKEKFQHRIKRAFALEEFVGRQLDRIYGLDNVEREQADYGVDYLVRANGKPKFAVQVKFTDTDLIPLRAINQIGEIAKNLGYPVVLVTNAALTKNAKYKFDKLNKELAGSNLYVASVNEIDQIEEIINRNA